MTSPASPPKIRLPACPTSRYRLNPTPGRDLELFHPLGHHQRRGCELALVCEAAALKTTGASATARARACRPNKATSSAPTRAAFAAAMPARATACRWRPSPAARAQWRDAARRLVQLERNATTWRSPGGRGPLRRQRALSRLGSRRSHHRMPGAVRVALAAGLLGGFVQAVSGGALYRKTSFCSIRWASRCSPSTSMSSEDPFILGGKGSSPYDEEGVRVRRARWSMAGGSRAISCRAPIRRASWA